jgi:putative endonuclease
MKTYYVYIMTNKYNTVFYTWVTNNLERRVYEHKNKLIDWFTKKYNIDKLLYYEECWDIKVAIGREKEVKDWRREKKINLIKGMNPELGDLSTDF